ncbi:M24 family metallopeptidase, partial [bacterium]|nr:M24 family metallopeptidase [bacterium]
IAHYKDCFKKTDDAVLATRECIDMHEGISEYDIEKALEENFYKYGAKSLSFKSIVAKDQNSAQAHYSKSSKDEILKDGSLILIDCGAYYEGGLATDSTRVFVKGEPTALQKEVYTKVLKAFLNAFATSVTTNTTGFEIDEVARKLLNKIKPDGFEFSHSLGHGIGISVHENPPSLSPSELGKTLLKPNMCFTIEPGLYNESHFGIRLENSCYLDENYKIQSFSHLPFEEKLIDYTLLTQQEQEILNGYNNKH